MTTSVPPGPSGSPATTGPHWATPAALLRAMLTGDAPTFHSLTGRLGQDHDDGRFGALMTAAFIIAVRRHFTPGYTTRDVIRLVAQIRAGSTEAASQIDPAGAERVVRAALGEPVSTAGIDDTTKAVIQSTTLIFLISSQDPSPQDVDAFLTEAQREADRLIHQATPPHPAADPPAADRPREG
jgi:hypothetical protein